EVGAPALPPGVLPHRDPVVVRLHIYDLLDGPIADDDAAERVLTHRLRESLSDEVLGGSRPSAEAGHVEQLTVEPHHERTPTGKKALRVLRDGVEHGLQIGG